MPIKINGATSGSVTLAAPATGSDVTVTLPAAAGTIPLSASATLTTATLSDPTLTGNVVWSGATLRAGTASAALGVSITSSSFTTLSGAPSVTVTTGTKALVIVTCELTGAANERIYAGFAVSGATTVAASDAKSLYIRASASNLPEVHASAMFLVTGLTAGSNTFTMRHRASASTGSAGNADLVVIDMGS